MVKCTPRLNLKVGSAARHVTAPPYFSIKYLLKGKENAESHQCERNHLKSALAVDQRDKESEESIFHLKESNFMTLSKAETFKLFITTTDKNSILSKNYYEIQNLSK